MINIKPSLFDEGAQSHSKPKMCAGLRRKDTCYAGQSAWECCCHTACIIDLSFVKLQDSLCKCKVQVMNNPILSNLRQTQRHSTRAVTWIPPGEVHGFYRMSVIFWHSENVGPKVIIKYSQRNRWHINWKAKQNDYVEAINGIFYFLWCDHSFPEF